MQAACFPTFLEHSRSISYLFYSLSLNESHAHILSLTTSVTRLGYFQKLLVTNCLIKVAQMFSDVWGYFKNHHFHIKTTFPTFGKTFGILGYFFILTSGHTAVTTTHHQHRYSFSMTLSHLFTLSIYLSLSLSKTFYLSHQTKLYLSLSLSFSLSLSISHSLSLSPSSYNLSLTNVQ